MKTILVTGGAGFIGANATRHFAQGGHRVAVLDDLSRRGSPENLEWLRGECAFDFHRADVRDADRVEEVVGALRPEVVLHLAGQVAVTTSVADPRTDFEINALGTFNVLEALRKASPESILLHASTNKVYGKLENLEVELRDGRWAFAGKPEGVAEDQPLDFHSPYGCSKGAADQYVRDYGRIYDIPAFVFRMSCQYGPRQFGNEDQGWVAHFVIATEKGHGLNIFGDGKQVRDVLYIEDLCRAFEMATAQIDKTKGEIFNIGGGRANVLSLNELVAHLGELQGREIPVTFGDWRPGDQKVYISNVAHAKECFGWEPTISKREGVEKLLDWVRANPTLFG
ncbi:MAG: GDP-mannose 4,6-dehydratase [Acidobacteria bacterium]|nr:GDP-mannose 4,6-dehydratase [Acidobacteriota bacterium]